MRGSSGKAQLLQVWVGNVHPEATEGELAELFKEAGMVIEAKMPQAKKHSEHKCKYAFVRFENTRDAEHAKQVMQGKVLRGHALVVADAQPASHKQQQQHNHHQNNNHTINGSDAAQQHQHSSASLSAAAPTSHNTTHKPPEPRNRADKLRERNRLASQSHRSAPGPKRARTTEREVVTAHAERERDEREMYVRSHPPELYVDEQGTPFYSELDPSQMQPAPPDEDWDAYMNKRGPPPVYYVCEGEYGDYLLPVDPRAVPPEQLPLEHPLSHWHHYRPTTFHHPHQHHHHHQQQYPTYYHPHQAAPPAVPYMNGIADRRANPRQNGKLVPGSGGPGRASGFNQSSERFAPSTRFAPYGGTA